LPFGEVSATMRAGTPAGAGARRLRCAVRGLAADRQVRWADERNHVNPMDRILDLYRAAAGSAALCELKLRLLANKVPELESIALAQNLDNIEKQLHRVFSHCLSSDDISLLETSRRLRNKILHADFFEARSRLAQLGVEQRTAGVVRVELDSLPGSSIVEKIHMIATGTVGTPVASTSSTQDGSILGWLLEFASSGGLGQAIRIFEERVSPLLERLFVEADNLPRSHDGHR